MGIQEEIARVAYELFEKKGKVHGSHVDDWLAAEKIVMARHARKEDVGIKLAKSGKSSAATRSPKGERTRAATKTSARKRTSSRKPTIEKT